MNERDPRSTRPSLLLRLRDPGDVTSWNSFAEIYGPLIRGFCRGSGLQEADASDVSQEVLTQVARSIRSFEYEPDRGRFRDWLGTVTRHKISRFISLRDRIDRPLGGEESTGHFDAIESPEADTEWTAAFHDRILQVALGTETGTGTVNNCPRPRFIPRAAARAGSKTNDGPRQRGT
jgi:RNA polymerase sigma factor (sigma-70 family)